MKKSKLDNFELKVKNNLSDEDLNEFLKINRDYFENKGYKVYFKNARYRYKGAYQNVQSNIQTGKSKNVSKQIKNNSKVEICAMKNEDWIRISGTLVNDDRFEAKKSLLDNYPELQSMYKADDDNTQVLYFENAIATISSFTKNPEKRQK